MIERKSWKEFQDAKLLWWVNRILHTFGWAVVLQCEADGTVTDAYPARVTFRGFSEDTESEGFKGLTDYLQASIDDLVVEVGEPDGHR